MQLKEPVAELVRHELGFPSPKCEASRGFLLFPGAVYKPGLWSVPTQDGKSGHWPVAFVASFLFEDVEAALSSRPQRRLEKGGASSG